MPQPAMSMRIRIVCYEDADGWILGKFARRLEEHLNTQGAIADIGKTPDPLADINHHIIYRNYNGQRNSVDTVMITHVEVEWKLALIKQQLRQARMAICMSRDTYHRLVHYGIPRHKVCFINPAHDNWFRPRKKLIGITSKVQSDGRKREHMLMELTTRIPKDDFKFLIMGTGWESIVEFMREQGVEVEYYDRFDLEVYRRTLPTFDYYLYVGQDEGSMGFLDALNAGIPTIVTPQGFHLDAANGITHAFNDLDELVKIFDDISKRLVMAVGGWTWSDYARKHLILWEHLLSIEASCSRADLKKMRVAKRKSVSHCLAILATARYAATHQPLVRIERHLRSAARALGVDSYIPRIRGRRINRVPTKIRRGISRIYSPHTPDLKQKGAP